MSMIQRFHQHFRRFVVGGSRVLHVGFCFKGCAATSVQHFEALRKYARDLEVHECAVFGELPAWLDLNDFDVVFVHYSTYLASDSYLTAESRQRLSRFRGLKVLAIQDEYRHVLKTIERIREIDFDLIFTCVPEAEMDRVYPPHLVRARKVNVLTGYVPDGLRKMRTPPVRKRSIHLGYRARKLESWYGDLAREKWMIVEEVLGRIPAGLAIDVSYDESARLYGDAWNKFMGDCRVALGVESGASVFDFGGGLQKTVTDFERAHPEMPYERIKNGFFRYRDGMISLNQISPRCFEAACLKTPMLLFEGEYSGILKPWVHYIPLKKDFSNWSEVIERMQDDNFLQELADRTYREVACDPKNSYKAMARLFEDEIVSETRSRGLVRRLRNPKPRLRRNLVLQNKRILHGALWFQRTYWFWKAWLRDLALFFKGEPKWS